MTPIEFKNPTGYVVQKVAIMRDRNHGAFISGQMLFQPVDAIGIKVVGRLVEQKNRRILQ